MKLSSKRWILGALATMIAFLAGTILAGAQAALERKPLMAEDIFTNVQVLRGISVAEFMGTMGFISASLSLNCLDCHVEESARDPAKYATDTPLKQSARRMLLMVQVINKQNFGGVTTVTCYTCHRGDVAPRFTPSLAEQYATPAVGDPNDIEVTAQPAPGAPSADQILDKYIQAVGGAQRLAGLTSFVAKGTYGGYDTFFAKVPFEVYVKAPAQRATVVHNSGGVSTTAYDGRTGWIAATNTPLPMVALTGADLDGAQLDAEFAFPAGIKEYLTGWHVGFPPTNIDDHDVVVVEGTAPQGSRVKLFFDKDSGLLVRMVRFTKTVLGLNPSEVDYADYRDVAGVKVPFKWTLTWTDGRSEFEMADVKPNVPIDASRFAKPAPPAAPKPGIP